jgi:hypothetical protein
MARRRYDNPLAREAFNLRLVIASLLFLLVGCAMIFLSHAWNEFGVWSAVLGHLGETVFVGGLIGVAWDFLVKRSLTDEIVARLGVAERIREGGIAEVCHRFPEDIEWDELFAGVRELDIFTAFARTWRRTNWERLSAAFQRKGVVIRVVLPDEGNETIVAALAASHGWKPEIVVHELANAEQFFRSLVVPNGASVSFSKMRVVQLYGILRFDKVIVMKFYNHDPVEKYGPALVVKDGGSIFPYLKRQIDVACASRREEAARPALASAVEPPLRSQAVQAEHDMTGTQGERAGAARGPA